MLTMAKDGCPSGYSSQLANWHCQEDFNRPECEYDGGDCCLEHPYSCLECDGRGCICHETGVSHCQFSTLEIILKGNGQCDDMLNNDKYEYDGGDCCLEVGDCTSCYYCKCHETGLRMQCQSKALIVVLNMYIFIYLP